MASEELVRQARVFADAPGKENLRTELVVALARALGNQGPAPLASLLAGILPVGVLDSLLCEAAARSGWGYGYSGLEPQRPLAGQAVCLSPDGSLLLSADREWLRIRGGSGYGDHEDIYQCPSERDVRTLHLLRVSRCNQRVLVVLGGNRGAPGSWSLVVKRYQRDTWAWSPDLTIELPARPGTVTTDDELTALLTHRTNSCTWSTWPSWASPGCETTAQESVGPMHLLAGGGRALVIQRGTDQPWSVAIHQRDGTVEAVGPGPSGALPVSRMVVAPGDEYALLVQGHVSHPPRPLRGFRYALDDLAAGPQAIRMLPMVGVSGFQLARDGHRFMLRGRSTQLCDFEEPGNDLTLPQAWAPVVRDDDDLSRVVLQGEGLDVFEVDTGQTLALPARLGLTEVQAAFNQAGDRLALASPTAGTQKLWDTHSGRLLVSTAAAPALADPERVLAFDCIASPGPGASHRLRVRTPDGAWGVAQSLDLPSPESTWVPRAVSPDGEKILMERQDGGVAAMALQDGALLWSNSEENWWWALGNPWDLDSEAFYLASRAKRSTRLWRVDLSHSSEGTQLDLMRSGKPMGPLQHSPAQAGVLWLVARRKIFRADFSAASVEVFRKREADTQALALHPNGTEWARLVGSHEVLLEPLGGGEPRARFVLDEPAFPWLLFTPKGEGLLVGVPGCVRRLEIPPH